MEREDLKKEIFDLLDNVTYWDTCPEDYKLRIEAVKKALTISVFCHQRKQLVAFAEWILSSEENVTSEMIEKDVKTFLATNCC